VSLGTMAAMRPTDERTRPLRAADVAAIDTPSHASVSFAPPETNPEVPRGTGRAPIPVGPGRPMAALPRSGPLRDVVNGFPIQLAKVQRPSLRDETLERPRLLDWLRAKTTGRVVLLLADAGYGKTTLLADFSRRTRMRTLWYRLDHEDRDWTSILHHLVAAGREHDPGFAPLTANLLAEVGVSGPSRDVVMDTFVRELPTVVEDGGVLLILDDFHLVDDAADARHIARELVARAPERVCIVFASRRPPTVPLARLRAVGEVAELGTDELRFDPHETELLFNETYGRRLEPDLVRELAQRTEGWAASLQMVNAALRDRSTADIRAFVRGLTGADQDLYDYLAEEVVGDLPADLQRFLMETSILQVVTPELARIATGLEDAQVSAFAVAAERMTLLTRRTDSPRTHQRYHPLVREFLEARFAAFDGHDAVRAMHLRVADATAGTDWRLGAHHYREAGELDRMIDVVTTAIPTIMGNGQYALAGSFITDIPPDLRPAGLALITSRVDMQQGDYLAAIEASQALLDSGLEDPVQRDHALLNLMTLHLNYGDAAKTAEFADALIESGTDAHLRLIATATKAIAASASTGSLDELNELLRAVERAQGADGALHLGVTLLNLAAVALLQDHTDQAFVYATRSLDSLLETSGRLESGNALTNLAVAYARQGDADRALGLLNQTSAEAPPEVTIEAAHIADSFKSPSEATSLFEYLSTRRMNSINERNSYLLTLTRHHIRTQEFGAALEAIQQVSDGNWTDPAFGSQLSCTRAYLFVAQAANQAEASSRQAVATAALQSAHAWSRVGRTLLAATKSTHLLSSEVAAIGSQSPWVLTYLADVLAPRLDGLTEEAMERIKVSAHMHPFRWRHELRRLVDDSPEGRTDRVGRVLEDIGEREDIRRLRSIARHRKGEARSATLGRGLARRLAHRVRFHDQGRIAVEIGDRVVTGSNLRRKVLALACYLISRPNMSCTRDQVLDALWPTLDPEVAVNSLNQTVYFLRRVFEEDYVEDESPGYVHHDSDVVWLDAELISSQTADCHAFLRSLSRPVAPDDVERLVDMYRGPFALDFAYEDWASDYRDSLHASYLELVERSVRDDLASGHHDRGIRVARAALEVEPTAEQIEVTLLRLYKQTGAHSAAAEQYGHYAAALRDGLGVDPPPLESL
jgi:DNA-binding SARP family transcriptional activator/tetratricopeptide (TPR) repeat protein